MTTFDSRSPCRCGHPLAYHLQVGDRECLVGSCRCGRFEAAPRDLPRPAETSVDNLPGAHLEEPARLGFELRSAAAQAFLGAGVVQLDFQAPWEELHVVQQAFWCAMAVHLNKHVSHMYRAGRGDPFNDFYQVVAVLLRERGGSAVVQESLLNGPRVGLQIKRHPAKDGLVCFELVEGQGA